MIALARNQIVREQVQAGEDVGERFVMNVDRIEMDLKKIILMIKEHENVVHALVLENANEDVEPHVVATPLLEKCEDDTHISKMGT